ncbi:PIG-L family deacetylase [Streptomyces sp. NPDC046557]|uniref:PIG-L family deacetylase n=1 Tax=Streptomyces sp. NPDC046557 TaxID=3155372 RepID=UPI0033DE9AF1
MAIAVRTRVTVSSLILCAALLASCSPIGPSGLAATAVGSSGCRRTLVVVAHPDDDLFFVNPDVMSTIRAGCFVSAVYLTAGDGDEEVPAEARNYIMNRENGVRRAYSEMAGSDHAWKQDDVHADGRSIRSFRLANPERGRDVRLTFLGLYDGRPRGSEPDSLLHLFDGRRKAITPLRGGRSYTEEQLLSLLVSLIRQSRAENVLTLDPDVASFAKGTDGRVDHSDHGITARYARQAAYRTGTRVVPYLGYTVARLPRNLTPTETTEKERFTRWYMAQSQCARERVCPAMKIYEATLSKTYRRWVERRYRRTHRDPRAGEIMGDVGRTTRSSGSSPEQCLAAPNGTWRTGEVRILGCDGSAGQKWDAGPDGTIRSRLDPAHCLTAAGSLLRLQACRVFEPKQAWQRVPWISATWKRAAWKLAGAGNMCLYQNDRSLPRWNRDTDRSPRLELVSCDGPARPGLYWRWAPGPPPPS